MLRPTHLSVLLGTLTLLAAGAAQAQVYRNVGPDGRISYSDKPPAAGAREAAAPAAAGSGGALPYQLNQTAQRYPVTLYTSGNCGGCNAGRNMLINRGVPFTEKTVESNDDAAALQRLSGSSDLPALTIGQQRLRGFNDGEWTQYLDAAGYPKSSQLPSGYNRPAPSPLVAAKAPAPASQNTDAAAPGRAPAAPAGPSVAPQRTPDNPAGIRF